MRFKILVFRRSVLSLCAGVKNGVVLHPNCSLHLIKGLGFAVPVAVQCVSFNERAFSASYWEIGFPSSLAAVCVLCFLCILLKNWVFSCLGCRGLPETGLSIWLKLGFFLWSHISDIWWWYSVARFMNRWVMLMVPFFSSLLFFFPFMLVLLDLDDVVFLLFVINVEPCCLLFHGNHLLMLKKKCWGLFKMWSSKWC